MSTAEFDSMVLHHSESLRPFAIALTRDYEAANDLCQEALYKAFAHHNKYEQGTSIKAWLYTIMRNIFINDYRRSVRKKVVLDTFYRSQTQYAPSSETGVRLKEIHEAIHQLPSIFRNAFMLYLEGYKYHEIASSLNEPLGTIKSRIHFARKLLQKQLER
jgi:RNA polymerase sigma factor (sigma-70 family)